MGARLGVLPSGRNPWAGKGLGGAEPIGSAFLALKSCKLLESSALLPLLSLCEQDRRTLPIRGQAGRRA